MNSTGKKCIECGTETVIIQIIDRGQKNIHYDFVYASGKSKSKFGKGHEIAGKINAELCENCGRITLRAAPKDVDILLEAGVGAARVTVGPGRWVVDHVAFDEELRDLARDLDAVLVEGGVVDDVAAHHNLGCIVDPHEPVAGLSLRPVARDVETLYAGTLHLREADGAGGPRVDEGERRTIGRLQMDTAGW